MSIISDGTEQLAVHLNIIDTSGEKPVVVAEPKLGFPLTHSKDQIVAELKAYLQNYKTEQANKVENKERDEQDATLTETIEYLRGGVIK